MSIPYRRFRSLLLALAAALLVACGETETGESTEPLASAKTYRWKLVTSWPKNFPGLGTAPERFAEQVDAMSGGRLKIKVYGAGELVPALEVFDAVSRGTAEMGHSGAYYWKGKVPAAQFFSAVPFGLNAQEMNGWIHEGGGLDLWRELYAPFGVIPFAGGNSGVQMAGWFNREILAVEDLKGLKMRIPGLGGEVMERLGVISVTLAGGEIFTALQTGAIDATEWVGPYNDLAFGLNRVGKYYYYPGWHEPGTTLELLANQAAFESLPSDLQAIVENAARAVNQSMLDEYTARNNAALQELVQVHGVQLRQFPEAVLARIRAVSAQVVEELGASSPEAQRVYDSYQAFREQATAYHAISEQAYINARHPVD
ncbi:MAG: TRAP transporter substrate-binding protein [Pseudomonadota bacterium]|nr:TRAP transporter substrate-binding protein [Pseudomonadota bacterium]